MKSVFVIKSKEVNLYTVLFGIILILLPFSVRLPNVIIAITAAYWLFFERNKKIKDVRTLAILLLLFASYAIGVIYSSNLPRAFFELEKRLPLLAFPFIFSTVTISRAEQKYLFMTFVVAVVLAALYCLGFEILNHHRVYQSWIPVNMDYFRLSELTQGIELDPPYFGLYIGFSLILAFHLLQEKAIPLWVFVALFAFLGVFIILSGARMAIVSLVISLFFYWGLGKKIKAIAALIVVVVIGVVFVFKDESLRNRFKDAVTWKKNEATNNHTSLSLRLAKWNSALSVIRANPLVGVGTGDAQDALNNSYLEHQVFEAYEREYNAHNQYLDVTVALGVVGLCCLLLNLGLSFYLSIKNRCLIYFVFITFFAICLLTESMLERQKGVVFFAFLNSMFAFSPKNADEA